MNIDFNSSGELYTPTDVNHDPILEYGLIYTNNDDTRPFLETKFDDYNVSEGILLLLLITLWVCIIYNILKNGFGWLKK